jgi:hypothetical protein
VRAWWERARRGGGTQRRACDAGGAGGEGAGKRDAVCCFNTTMSSHRSKKHPVLHTGDVAPVATHVAHQSCMAAAKAKVKYASLAIAHAPHTGHTPRFRLDSAGPCSTTLAPATAAPPYLAVAPAHAVAQRERVEAAHCKHAAAG